MLDEEIDDTKGTVMDLVLPIAVLVVCCVIGMIYSGGFFSGENFVDAFSNSDASIGLMLGSAFGLVFAIVYYLIRRSMSFKEMMGCIPDGFKAMVPAIMILTFAWSLKGMTDSLGAKYFVRDFVRTSATGVQLLLPVIVFAVGCLLAFALFHKRIHAFRDSVNDAATNSLIALMNTAVVTGFGGVVQGSHGFELVKEFALSLDMNPLISACVATAIVAAACGSCSGGLSVFLAALGPQYVQLCQAQGIDPQILHRSITWAGAGLDSLPHSGGYVTANIYTDQPPKGTYPYFFVTNIGLTTLGCVLTVALYMLFGLV